jgi:hypothetical protein
MAQVQPLDIDNIKGKCKNRVALVSVELEGGWVELPKYVQALEHDGSVFDGRRPSGVNHIGELSVGPALPAGIEELIRANHPPKVNHTCGMHMHMSFETLRNYQLLMVPEYQKTVLHYLTQWAFKHKIPETHCLWSRLRGESRFCREEFWPDLQAGNKRKSHDQNVRGHRYTHVHYCGRYNTIEIRTLPMFQSVKIGVSAIHELIDITNACIYVLGQKPEAKHRNMVSIDLPNGMSYEETIIEEV